MSEKKKRVVHWALRGTAVCYARTSFKGGILITKDPKSATCKKCQEFIKLVKPEEKAP